MKKITIRQIVLIALTVLVLTSIAADGGRQFTTTMTGAAEVNAQGVPNQGDLDGSGTATITLNYGQGTICWELSVSGITLPAAAAHIHKAPVTAPGPVVVPLSAPDASGFASGCATVDRDQIKDIIQHPEEYYVNVHNADFLSGAVRGQLSK
jgi:CHRD domain-containing protein